MSDNETSFPTDEPGRTNRGIATDPPDAEGSTLKKADTAYTLGVEWIIGAALLLGFLAGVAL